MKINEQPVRWVTFEPRLEKISGREQITRFLFAAGSTIEFQIVAKVIDVMQASGISSVGLLTLQSEQGH